MVAYPEREFTNDHPFLKGKKKKKKTEAVISRNVIEKLFTPLTAHPGSLLAVAYNDRSSPRIIIISLHMKLLNLIWLVRKKQVGKGEFFKTCIQNLHAIKIFCVQAEWCLPCI